MSVLTHTSPRTGATAGVLAYLVSAGAILLLMMVFGLAMRLEQAQIISIGANHFYELMTLHGIGMVGVAALGGAAIMWHFLRSTSNCRPRCSSPTWCCSCSASC
ncbi:MAG: hypothetical protein ROZ09_00545 [Thiobacillus sp.]|jgi:cytochrome c oxidase subunit 1|uniref:cbb3-type cytochrome c oxidase subunit I n=1 Tax=Thiobacillus sp. TaxID=924 RepID=UPI00289499CD|nr:hypothetical protein [Thiobacillus sp.]MDT3705283.1 hypothetical protein [Thiobacillus sp.]